MRQAADQTDATDEALVLAATEGDGAAFDVLVERYQSRVFNILLRLCGSAEEAEDLTQDAFVQAYRALGSFNKGSKFYTWLFRIAVNRGLTQRRQDVRRRAKEGVRLDAPVEGRSGGGNRSGGGGGSEAMSMSAVVAERHSSDPVQQLLKEELRHRIQTGLMELESDHRAVLILREIEGLDYDTIAETLTISRAAVKSRLHRARLELARVLKDLRPITRNEVHHDEL
jgi:RNA polymerase sigma-70 factor (ECF subfamily)